MTDSGRRPTARKPPPRACPAVIYSGSLALFVAAAGGIAAQIATGHDPALGVGEQASTPAVTVKHIKKTTVITKVIHDPPAAGATSSTYSPAAVPAPQPSDQAPAPQQAPVQQQAPAPAPAPAPAAAPAQPTTRSS